MAEIMVVAAAPASAAVGNVSYPVNTTSVNSDVFKEVTVFCPIGKKILGGSYEITGAEGAVVLDNFVPFNRATPTGFVVSGLQVSAGEIVGDGESDNGTNQSWGILARAVCGSPPPGYSIIPRTSSFLDHIFGESITAPCPPGRHVIGGGASLDDGFGQVSIERLEILPTEIRATAAEDVDDYHHVWSVSAYAICADPLPGWQVVSKKSDLSALDTTKTEAAHCPLHQKVIGAAWAIEHPDLFSSNDPDRFNDNDWYVARTAMSPSPDPGVTASAHAAKSPPTLDRWSVTASAVCVD